MKFKSFSVLADIIGVIGFCLALFISFNVFPNTRQTSFDYQAVLVGIIGGIFTLLVGWNIHQMVDWRDKFGKLHQLETKIKRETNYLHNKIDWNTALTYGYLSQRSAALLLQCPETTKAAMILNGLISIKMFSKFPNELDMINPILNSMVEGLNASKNIKLSDTQIEEFLIKCGEIDNRDRINKFNEFIQLLIECRCDSRQ